MLKVISCVVVYRYIQVETGAKKTIFVAYFSLVNKLLESFSPDKTYFSVSKTSLALSP